MGQPWFGYPITQRYDGHKEYGIDLQMDRGTPITALYAGVVRWAGRTEWSSGTSSGGEVTIVCNVPGKGLYTSYYLHLDDAYVKPGDQVQAGQIIGVSGGQLSGGKWPVVNGNGIILSDGPHIEFGFNAPWVSGPGQNIDPYFAIFQARSSTLPVTYPDGSVVVSTQSYGAQSQNQTIDPTIIDASLLKFYNLSATTQKVISQPTGFDGICEALDSAEEFPEWNWFNVLGSIWLYTPPILVRLTFVAIAQFIILAVVWSWIQKPIESGLGAAASLGALAAAPEAAPLVSMSHATQQKAR